MISKNAQKKKRWQFRFFSALKPCKKRKNNFYTL